MEERSTGVNCRLPGCGGEILAKMARLATFGSNTLIDLRFAALNNPPTLQVFFCGTCKVVYAELPQEEKLGAGDSDFYTEVEDPYSRF